VIKSRTVRGLLSAAFALVVPVTLAAQTPESAQPAEPTAEEMQSWFIEMQQVHEQLEGLQRDALMDPELSAQQEELGEEIRVAMEVADPMMEQRMTRVQELQAEATAAQGAGDTAKLQELMTEAQQIQQHFMTVQESALADPAIATKLETFQTQLEAKMVEIDPEAEALITRFRELEEKLSGIVSGG
jgi:hypothetical protein